MGATVDLGDRQSWEHREMAKEQALLSTRHVLEPLLIHLSFHPHYRPAMVLTRRGAVRITKEARAQSTAHALSALAVTGPLALLVAWPRCRCSLSVHVAGGLGSHLLTEEPETVGMAEGLPGVEDLEEGMGE